MFLLKNYQLASCFFCIALLSSNVFQAMEEPTPKTNETSGDGDIRNRNWILERLAVILGWYHTPELPWDQYYQGPLHRAASNGDIESMKRLLKDGTNPNVLDSSQATPLHIATENGNAELVQLLLENGARPDVIDAFAATPLFIAARDGKLEIVQLLLKHGAPHNVADSTGCTPLHMAAANRHLEVVQALLAAGATNVAGRGQLSALSYAKTPEIYNALVNSGAGFSKLQSLKD